MIVKAFIMQHHYILCVLFLFLLTIILFAMARVVIKMVYGEKHGEKFEIAKNNIKKITISMYIPQIFMLICAFTLGLYIPQFLEVIIKNSIIG